MKRSPFDHPWLAVALLAALAPTPSSIAAGEDFVEAPFPLPLLGWSTTSPGGSTAALTSGTGGGLGTSLSFGSFSGNVGNLFVENMRFIDVPLPDGTEVDLEVTMVKPEGLGFGIHVDGVPQPDLLSDLGLYVYMGKVVGHEQSSVALGFSIYGSRGWIQREDDLFHLMAQAGPNNWNPSISTMVSNETLLAWGNEPATECATETPSMPFTSSNNQGANNQGWQTKGGKIAMSADLYECSIAVETDDQLYQWFNDLNAETTYVTTLLTWVSYRYQEQIQTVLTFPYVNFYTQGNDPWHSQDSGGSMINLLDEFQAAWGGNVPNNATLAHFLSGAMLGGGVAYFPGICNEPYNFGVSGNVAGTVQFPVVQQGGNWDFIVAAHEIGHNFLAPHTHEYCPPLDQCYGTPVVGCWPVQANICTNQGTLMSYCHLCPGGEANITTYFHPQNVSDMRSWVSGIDPFDLDGNNDPNGPEPNWCGGPLPLYVQTPVVYCTAKVNSKGCTPAIDSYGHATLSGPDDFHITASNIINNQDGLLFFGLAQMAKPFQGGFKCVQAPTWRTGVQNSGGSAAGIDCTGTYDMPLSHLLFNFKGIAPGQIVYAQYWSHDIQSPFGVNLTDAIQFELGN